MIYSGATKVRVIAKVEMIDFIFSPDNDYQFKKAPAMPAGNSSSIGKIVCLYMLTWLCFRMEYQI
jgi:hypothetical protein